MVLAQGVSRAISPKSGGDQGRGEHFTEFVKNPWGKVCLFWDLGKSSLKLNSACVVAI